MNKNVTLCLLAALFLQVFLPGPKLTAQNFTDIQAAFSPFVGDDADWGDFDGDGDLDIAACGYSTASSNYEVVVYRNDGGGNFTAQTVGTAPNSTPNWKFQIQWVDLDCDGDLDISIGGLNYNGPGTELFLFRNDGGLVFTQVNHNVTYLRGYYTWADLDNDGKPELINGGQDTNFVNMTKVYRYLGSGYFQTLAHNLPSMDLGRGTDLGDYDNDGDLDIFTYVYPPGVGYVYRNDGDLVFTPINTGIPNFSGISLGDYDGDGDLDVHVVGGPGGRLFRNDGGNFVLVNSQVGWVTNSGTSDFGDYDNDGDLDILVGGGQYVIMYYLPPVMQIFRNDGNNNFSLYSFTNDGFDQGAFEWGDYNNDGKLDILAWGQLLGPSNSIIYGNSGSSPANAAPSAPQGLHAFIAPDSSIAFRWNRATDAISPSAGLSYRLRITTAQALPDISAPLADTVSGKRLVADMGDLQDTTWSLKRFPLGQTFYAQVQAIDQGMMGSAWSPAIAVSDSLLAGILDATVAAGFCDLTAVGAAFVDSLRWYQCSPWQMVPGADQAVFQPGNANAYAVVLYEGGQSDTSACTTINVGFALDTSLQVLPCYAVAPGSVQADSVHWVDCGTMQPLPGETSQVFFPQDSGHYRAVLYHCNGTDSSACHFMQGGMLDTSVVMSTCGFLASGATGADSVRWINCNTMQPIPGATGTSYLPPSAGDFALVVYDCQRSDTSACYSWQPFTLNTTVNVAGAVLSLPGGPLADSVKWLQCGANLAAGPIPDNYAYDFHAIVSGYYRAILYHCNGADTTACHYVDAQFVELTNSAAPLVGVNQGSVDWGDFDNDGDLDLLVTGVDTFLAGHAELYRNNGNGTFTSLTTTLPAFELADVAWGDYDNDGDLDLLMAGWWTPANQALSTICRNDGNGVFTDIMAGFDSMLSAAVTWADYDNDGDLDAFLCGRSAGPVCKLYRNDGSNQFSPASATFDGAVEGSADWGDYDNDGDLDLVYMGVATGATGAITRLYRNDGSGAFTSISHNFPHVFSGSVRWCDYDSDGYLDLFICGFDGNSVPHSELYHNNSGGSFSQVSAGFIPKADGEADWGDFDNDGDQDLIITGGMSWGNMPIVRLYRNQGTASFEEITTWPHRPSFSAAEWGDFDGDGDLDLAISGPTYDGWETVIYRNDSVPASNLIPQAPGVVTASASGPGSISFSWSPGSDATTATPGLSYQLMIGTTPTGMQVVSPMVDTQSGLRLLPARGPSQNTVWTLGNVQNLQTYYARVLAIDAGKSASQPSTQAIVTGLGETGNTLLLQAGPVPTRDFLHVLLPGTSGPATLELIDLQGRTVRAAILKPSDAELNWDLRQFSAGTYLLRWTGGGDTEPLNLRVLKE